MNFLKPNFKTAAIITAIIFAQKTFRDHGSEFVAYNGYTSAAQVNTVKQVHA